MSPKCYACGGRGTTKCQVCNGTGKISRGGSDDGSKGKKKITCTHCRGTGVINCSVCGGSGRR